MANGTITIIEPRKGEYIAQRCAARYMSRVSVERVEFNPDEVVTVYESPPANKPFTRYWSL